MFKRLVPFVAILLVLVFAVSADAAERRRRAKPEPPPPPQFKVDVATRTIELARLGVGLASNATIGKFAMCGTGIASTPIYIEEAFRGLRQEDLAMIFSEEARLAGYSLPDSRQGNLFSDQTSSKAELLIGAGITAMAMNSCGAAFAVFSVAELEITMTIDWQVFDPLEKKMLFRASNTASHKMRGTYLPEKSRAEATSAAFRNAAKGILADPIFLAAVKETNGGALATTDSLFPEASATSGTVPTQIAQLPLRTAEFHTQVSDLRQHVVTVLTPGGTGSGFYVSNNLLLTNHHVIEGYTSVKIRFFGGREIDGSVLASNGRRDIALIQTETQSFAGLALRAEPPPEASPVYVIGSPLGQEQEGTISAGIISGFRDHEFGPMIQSDVVVTFGNSGGPMFDDKGNVIALVDTGKNDDYGNPTQVKLFIPIADALKVLKIDFAPLAAAAK